MKRLLILLILISICQQSFAQATTAFNQYANASATTDVAQLQDQDLMITGIANGLPAVIRADLNGNPKWSKVLYSASNGLSVSQIMQYNASIIYLLGKTYPGNGAALIKADTGGNIKWAKRITRWNYTAPVSMIKTHDSDLLVFITDSNASILVKLDTSGNEIWDRRFFTNNVFYSIYATPYGGYAQQEEGPGNVIELPDHSITLAANFLQTYDPRIPVFTQYTAVIINMDPKGNMHWAKKLQPLPILYNGYPVNYNSDAFLSSVGDILYTSDNKYIFSLGGNYTIRMDSAATTLWGNGIGVPHPLSLISEYPPGIINMAESGGMCCGDIIFRHDGFTLFQVDLASNTYTGNVPKPPLRLNNPIGTQVYQYFVRQLNDKRIVSTGTVAGYSNEGMAIITDSNLHESCSAQIFSGGLSNDTTLHIFDASILVDSGITIQSFVVNDSFVTLRHCNCDSLPKAKFGTVISGFTVYCYDSSQNALTYLWNFGDGTTDTSRNPVHTYFGTMTHTITCTAYNACGFDVYSYQLYPSCVFDSIKPACNGSCNGYIHAKVSGATPPYTYSWSPVAQLTASANNLCPGTYQLIVTDNNNISSPPYSVSVISDTTLAAITQYSNVTCYGHNNGTAIVTTSSGIPPFTYSWNNTPSIYSDTVTTLFAGVNIVTVTDSDKCAIQDTVTISQPAAIIVTNTIHNVSCYSDSDGYITTITSGGVLPYTYIWDNDTQLNRSGLYGLHAGTHILSIKDSNYCVHSDTVIVIQPAQLNSSYITTNPLCYSSTNGAISATASGGTSPYSYVWNIAPFQNIPNLTGLHAGTYTVVVTDVNNCNRHDTIALIQPAQLSDSTNKRDVACNGHNNGLAAVYPYGGTAPYNIVWSTSTSQYGDTAYSLYAGTYSANITDSNGCFHTDSVHISQPAALSLLMNAIPDTGNCTGTALVNVSGGTPPYRYRWDTNDTTQAVTGLCGNMYHIVLVADKNGCLAVDSVLVLYTEGVRNIGSANNITITPDPFTEDITIEWSHTQLILRNIRITDLTGKTIASFDTNNVLRKSVATSSWTPGFYFITITDGQGSIILRKKVVKN